MLDDDDIEFTALWWPGNGWLSLILGVVVLGLMYWAVSQNHAECARQHCATGTPVLMEHECLCVEKAHP